jgi:tRNA(Ile)-lysidine synthase
LISPEEIVVVGLSGGADSVCLLHVLAKWQKRLRIKLHVAHLNHQLRGIESEFDAEYVSNLAGSLSIPSTIERQDVADYRTERKCSIEEAARELRYAFFARVAKEVGANRIAIGHTSDDQVETVLMHILRGTGITGLCGLVPCSPMVYGGQGMSLPASSLSWRAEALSVANGQRSNLLVIRPLLDITREETTNYCQEHQLNPRIDSSNLSLSFFRNRLRLQLLPLLRQYNPSIDQALLRLADIAKEDNAFIEQHASELWGEVARQENNAIYLNRKKIASLPIALQRQLTRVAVTKLAGDTRDFEANHIEAVRSLLDKPVGKQISLPHGLICQGGYDELIIVSPDLLGQSQLPPCPFPPLLGKMPLKVPGKTIFSGWKVIASIVQEQADEGHCEHLKGTWQSLEIASSPSAPGNDREEGHLETFASCHPDFLICHSERSEESQAAQGRFSEAISANFDLRKTGIELFVRQRWPGDRFQPLGMSMPKKLHKFMVDVKIPRSWRSHVPIVCSPQQIIWVVGWRIDDRVKVTEASQEILHLEFISSQ